MPLKLTSNNRQNDMDPIDLKILMMKAGVQQKDIAESLNPKVAPASVHLVIEGRMTSHRIRKAISDRIGVDLKRIWPSTYLYGGGPRKPGRPRAV